MNQLNRRSILANTPAFMLLATGAKPLAAPADYDAIVSKTRRGAGPLYGNLSEALEKAPPDGTRPFRILVTSGEWRGSHMVTKPFIHLIGQSRDHSVIVSNRSSAERLRGEKAPAALIVKAPDFRAENITIANDYDYVAHMPPEVPYERTGNPGGQAQALLLDSGSDRSIFEHVRLVGYQDTLWADSGEALFNHCEISGCVDFIYGAGRALFYRCDITSRLRPGKDFNGYIAAPDTDVDQAYGLVFVFCRLLKEKGVAPHTVALGRPWRHTGTFPDGRYGDPRAVGQAVYVRCWMDDHIVPEGWYRMQYYIKGGEMRFMEPEEARFFEYRSRGPGAGTATTRRRMLTQAEVAKFAPAQVLGDWHPHYS